MKITTFILALLLGGSISTAQYYKGKADILTEYYEDERDCRFSLEIYIRRKQDQNFRIKSSYGICDLNPLSSLCSCRAVFDRRDREKENR